MLAYMREKGQYIQYYNAGGSIDTSFLTSGAADSFFKDYGWSTSGAKNETAQYGYKAVFGGFEAGGARWPAPARATTPSSGAMARSSAPSRPWAPISSTPVSTRTSATTWSCAGRPMTSSG